MTLNKTIRTALTGVMAFFVLFSVQADEIQDGLQAGRDAELTRTAEQRENARRTLENARDRLRAEVNATEESTFQEPENLAGEINALEQLKAKLKRELDTLRETQPTEATRVATSASPAVSPNAVPVVEKVVRVETVVSPSAVQKEEWTAFQNEVARQIADLREKNVKGQVEQRAAVAREREEALKILNESWSAELARLKNVLAKDQVEREQLLVLTSELQAQIKGLRSERSASDVGEELAGLKKDLAEVKERQKEGRKKLESLNVAGMSAEERAELLQYRKSLESDVANLREQLKKQLHQEIALLAGQIAEERLVRQEWMQTQEKKLAGMRGSLEQQIAEGLASLGEGNISQKAFLAAVGQSGQNMRQEMIGWQEGLETRMKVLEEQTSQERAKGVALRDFMARVDTELAALQADTSGREFIVQEVGAAGDLDSSDLVDQRVRLEELRERLRASLDEFNHGQQRAEEQAEQERIARAEVQQEALRTEIRQVLESDPEALGQADRLDKEEGVEPILLKDESPKKRWFGWFRKNKKPEDAPVAIVEELAVVAEPVVVEPEFSAPDVEPLRQEPELLEEVVLEVPPPAEGATEELAEEASMASEQTIQDADGEKQAVEGVAVADPEQEGMVEEAAMMEEAVADVPKLEASVLEEELAEEVVDAMSEEQDPAPTLASVETKPRRGLFGFLRRDKKASDEPAKAEELLTVQDRVEGGNARPLRKGDEGTMVRGMRGVVDTQMATISAELNRNPVFDLSEIVVAPARAPSSDGMQESGTWSYEGSWAKGRMNGDGVLTYSDGRVYTGSWNNGVREGQGSLQHPDGWTFTGEWGNGLINGFGTLSYTDGWTYEGEWKKGKMHGQGVLKHPDGWTYTGIWKDGAMDGEGVLTYADGWTYEGGWEKGLREGFGTLRHPDGWEYVGDWSEGRRTGSGRLSFADGWVYEGEWKDGTMNGFGQLLHPQGWAYEGNWKNGEMAGDGKISIQP